MNNQQFIMMIFGSLSLVAFLAMVVVERLGNPKKKHPAAEPDSQPRSAD
jgi:hypothetical protein